MLETLNLDRTLARRDYERAMPALAEKLRRLQYAAKDAEVPVILCLEGWDTAGKGDIIKKLTEKLDPRLFRVHPGSAPSPLEQRHHFLWRYQTALPADGEMGVFDHSWYGRVLVERCDKLVPKKVWRDAYQQINEFERWLTDDGQVLVKLWLQISKKEQGRRFRSFRKDSTLRWKITPEYERHHRHYRRWRKAVEEMLTKTNTPNAPWTPIEATDPHWARVRAFETVIGAIETALERRKSAPAAISRTNAAVTATRAAREERKRRDSERAHTEEKNTPKENGGEKPRPEVARA